MVKLLQKATIVALFVIFMLSIAQSVLAENGSNDDVENESVEGSVEETASDSEDSGNNDEEVTGDEENKDFTDGTDGSDRQKDLSDRQKKIKGKKILKNALHLRKTVQIEKKLDNAKERLRNARENYESVKEKYHEAKEKLQKQREFTSELKKEAKACKDDVSEQCHKKKLELKKGVKQHLIKTIEVIERSLEKLTSRVEEQKVLSDEEKEKALAMIAELENKLAAERQEIEALAENASAEELRNAIKELKQTWQDVRKAEKRIVAALISSKMENLIEKHEEYANAMQLRIDELSGKGADVSELRALLQEFKESIVQLKEDYASVEEAWIELGRGRDVLAQWHRAQLKVREDLHETKSILARFLLKYKEIKRDLQAAEEVSEEEISEESEEASSGSGSAEENADNSSAVVSSEASANAAP